jgi:hypothetical protein
MSDQFGDAHGAGIRHKPYPWGPNIGLSSAMWLVPRTFGAQPARDIAIGLR